MRTLPMRENCFPARPRIVSQHRRAPVSQRARATRWAPSLTARVTRAPASARAAMASLAAAATFARRATRSQTALSSPAYVRLRLIMLQLCPPHPHSPCHHLWRLLYTYTTPPYQSACSHTDELEQQQPDAEEPTHRRRCR